MTKPIAVIRIRGTAGTPGEIEDTLKMLKLTRPNHMRIFSKPNQSILGMIKKIEEYVTWGEIDQKTIEHVLRTRGRTIGNKRLTEEHVKEIGFNGISELAQKIFSGEIDINKIKTIKPIFRLTPPSGGFKNSTKRHYSSNGELGYRGAEINKLIERMC